MSSSSTLDRLAALAPVTADDTHDVMPLADRRALLARLLADETVAAGREHPSTRLRSLRWRVAASVAAGVAFAMIGVSALDTDHARPGGMTAAPAGAAHPEAFVLDRIRLAVSDAESLILRVRTDPGTGVLWDDWFDETGGRARSTSRTPEGAPMYDHEFGQDAEGFWVRVVSHNDRAWWEYRSDRLLTHGWSAADIRKHLDAGTLEQVSQGDGGGRGELQLRWAPEEAPDGVRLQPGDLWVDADTYLPLRSVVHDRGRTMTMQFDWLERTPEHLAGLDAPVPGSYRKLPGAPEAPAGEPGVG